MPKEIRRLSFSHNEAKEALKQYSDRFSVTLPEGKMLHARFENKNAEESAPQFIEGVSSTPPAQKRNRTIVVTFFAKPSMEHRYYNLTEEFVTAALIQYCIVNKIMMPKDAKKTLDITDFNLCLDIDFSFATNDTEQQLTLDD